MPEATEQQIFDNITKAKSILVALPQNPSGDCIGGGLALHAFLKKLDKQPEIVCAAKDLSQFSFLPASGEIKKGLDISQTFVISVNTQTISLDELSYQQGPGSVDIFLKPKAGRFTEGEVSFRSAKFPYDLIITVGVPSLENIGEIYEKNTDLFFETPVLNIDHHPGNGHYGEINLVDLAATSTSEILANLMENFEASLIDANIATDLLTGIIVETNSFQHVKTTPKAFLKASSLISQGANQPEIIKHLYKTKQVSLLKLWGRALARIKEVPELEMTYSLINHTDLEKSGSGPDDVLGVMKELIANLGGRKIILFLAETKDSDVTGYFYLHPNVKGQIVSGVLGAQMLNGNLGVFRVQGKDLLQLEQEIIEKLIKIKSQIIV